jgi:hypothetical protein
MEALPLFSSFASLKKERGHSHPGTIGNPCHLPQSITSHQALVVVTKETDYYLQRKTWEAKCPANGPHAIPQLALSSVCFLWCSQQELDLQTVA